MAVLCYLQTVSGRSNWDGEETRGRRREMSCRQGKSMARSLVAVFDQAFAKLAGFLPLKASG
jgi:hypothetical protein